MADLKLVGTAKFELATPCTEPDSGQGTETDLTLADQIEPTAHALTAERLATLSGRLSNHDFQTSEGRPRPLVPHRNMRPLRSRYRSKLAPNVVRIKPFHGTPPKAGTDPCTARLLRSIGGRGAILCGAGQ